MSTLNRDKVNLLDKIQEAMGLGKSALKKVDTLSTYVNYRLGAEGLNDIGVAGQAGFGVGVCPKLPAGFTALSGYDDKMSDNYGNYQYSDGSIMVWVPAFFYKYGSDNSCDIKAFHYFSSVDAANAQGYALHRAFWDGGEIQLGVFVDKYSCSNNGGIASSLKNQPPVTSALRGTLTAAQFNQLTGAPSNTYAGAIAAAKTRGTDFFCNSIFIFKALALLSYAHARASTNATYCAWYNATYNFPKGNNNNAYADINDTTVTWTTDGNGTYNCGLTGSANLFARTTHNGQNCGVADLNGNVWEIAPGLTQDSSDPAVGNFYVLKTSVAMKDVTGGNTLATDLWGATGLAALYDDLGLMNSFTGYALNFSDRQLSYGSASQVLSAATSGTAWQMTGAGVPLVAGGTNAFGSDGLYDYSTADLCPVSGGSWYDAASAGVWALNLVASRSNSANAVGLRAALYL